MSFRDNLPVSRDWLNKLEHLGATDCFNGKLGDYGTQISKPFWARSLNSVLPPGLFGTVDHVIPAVRRQRLGGKNNSPKLERHRYYTAAWSSHPCQCQYRYEGFYSLPIGCIGNPKTGPPLRIDKAEALIWF